jgi:hypothetical protein
MSSTSDAFPTSFATARIKEAGSNYTYSRKRWSVFDAWQEQVRKSAVSGNSVSPAPADRDLRRAIVAG